MKRCFFVLFFLILISSTCFAYSPNDILADLTTLRDKGVISGLPTDYSPNAAWTSIIQKYNQKGNLTDYFIAITSSNSSYYSNTLFIGIVYQASGYSVPNQIKNYTTAQNNDLRFTWTGYNNNTIVYGFDSSAFNLNGSNKATGTFDYGKAIFSYFYTTININTLTWQQEAGSEYGGSYLLSSFEFTPTDTSGYINVHAFGTTESFIRRPFSTTVSNTRLGYISNINDFYYIEGKFYYFINDSGDHLYSDAIAGFTKNQTGLYTNNLYLNSNGEVGVSTSKLLNKQGVALSFIYKETPESDYEYSDSYYYYTYYYGTNIQSRRFTKPRFEHYC